MSTVQTSMPARAAATGEPSAWSRLKGNRNWAAFWFMLPTAAFLILFLAYPLGLGVWMSFTDERIGRAGAFIGVENYQWLWDDSIFWLSVFNTLLYTLIASAIKFAIGLYLALLLNRHMPFKAVIRSIVLIPFIVPTVLSAIAFWWIYDPQFSIISYLLVDVLHLRDSNVDFLGSPWPARFSLIAANIWRGIPFVAISLLAGLQTISPSLYEAAMLDGATSWQRFRYITFPMMMPILAIVMTFSIIFTFTDFQLVYAITRGGPVNSTHLLATLAFQRGIAGGELGEEFGVAGMTEAGAVQHVLGDRIGDDGAGLAGGDVGDGLTDRRQRGICAAPVWLARSCRRRVAGRNDGQGPFKCRGGLFGADLGQLHGKPERLGALGQGCEVPKQIERRQIEFAAAQPCGERDVGADACGLAGCQCKRLSHASTIVDHRPPGYSIIAAFRTSCR